MVNGYLQGWDPMRTAISFDDVLHRSCEMTFSGYATGFYGYCWYNALTLLKHSNERLTAYYGIAGDKELTAHMWLSADGTSVIETTEREKTYKGVKLTSKQAANMVDELTRAPDGERIFNDCYRMYKIRGIIRGDKDKTTSRIISEQNKKYQMKLHPVLFKEAQKEKGKWLKRKYLWNL